MNYKLLGRSGLRVSELCLGTMTFGTEWGWGADKETSRAQFQKFTEAGGNFIDTANRYTEGTSERFVGEFTKEAGLRDQLVIATKYSLHTQYGRINDGGNHRKNMIQSVEGSLQRLATDYIDVLYLHAWDFMTPEDEVMRGLDDLVRSGKVLYVAVSDTPAWVVARCNTLADWKGWAPFIGLQIEYSLITREAERELLPMAEALDLGMTAWAPLAGGALTGKYLKDNDEPKRLKEDSKRLNEKSTAIARECVKIGEELGCSAGNIALRWCMERSPVMIPIVGARKAEHIEDNLKCLDVRLEAEHFERLEAVSALPEEFPHQFLHSDGVRDILHGGKYDQIINHRQKNYRS